MLTVSAVPEGIDRLSIPVSMVKGARNNKVLKIQNLGEIFKYITSTNGQFKAFSEHLRQLKSSNPEQYSKIKETECLGFIVGEFSKRTDKDCKKYVPLIGFDIDSLGDTPLDIFLSDIKKSPYVFAAFPSPSYQGFRIFVWCDANPETHKIVYEQVCAHLSDILNIPTNKQLRAKKKKIKGIPHIDAGTNNISRLWFFAHVETDLLYLNTDSKVFVPTSTTPTDTIKRPPTKRPSSNSKAKTITTVSIDQKIKLCIEKVNRQTIAPGRNNFVFSLACELCRHGVDKSRALDECRQYQEDGFNEAEIKKTVNSAYQKSQFAEFSDQQILSYLRKGNKLDKLQPGPNSQKAEVTEKKEALEKEDPKEQQKKQNKFQQIKGYLFRKYEFRRNIIAFQIEYKLRGSKKEWQELNDSDLVLELMEIGWTRVDSILGVILKSSLVPDFDPIQSYFNNLPSWDESKADYVKDLANFVKAKDQHWFNSQFKKHLVRAAACALGMIPFNKQCLTFVSNQNDGKTSFVRFLCPPTLKDYFQENVDTQNKDGRLALATNFLINLDELANLSKYETTRIKAFFTISQIKERLPYEKRATTHKRKASFFGSHNSKEFLTDETGNIRWLVFEIEGINHDFGGPNGYNQKVDIDLVWSQVIHLLRSGFDFQLTKAEIAKSERNNKSHQVATIEQEFIEERYVPAQKEEYDQQPTMNKKGELIAEAEKVIQFKMTKDFYMELMEEMPKFRTSQRAIGRALRFLGYMKSQKFIKAHNQQRKGYYVKKL